MSMALTLHELARRAGVPVTDLEQWQALGLLGEPRRETFSPRDLERARLIALFQRRGIDLDAIATWVRRGEMERHLDLLAPPSTRAHRTLQEVCTHLGLDPDFVRRVWQPADVDLEMLDDEDLQALGALKAALDTGFPEDALAQLVRVYADTMQRVAATEARLFHFHVWQALLAQGLPDEAPEEATAERIWSIGARASELDEPVLLYFHRKALRHALADTAVLELAQRAGLATAGEAGRLEVAIAFVDLSSFTPLAESKGDLEAAQVIERFSTLVRQATAADGHVEKQMGDAFMLVFPEPRSALACALEIQGQAAAEPQFPAVRAGIHWGQVLYREGDYLGANVNIAARVADAADRRQVLVTEAVRRAVVTMPGVEFVPQPRRRLKGLADDVELYLAQPGAAGGAGRAPCPVCGLELAPAEVAATLQLAGRRHDFCSESCMQRFVAGRAT